MFEEGDAVYYSFCGKKTFGVVVNADYVKEYYENRDAGLTDKFYYDSNKIWAIWKTPNLRNIKEFVGWMPKTKVKLFEKSKPFKLEDCV